MVQAGDTEGAHGGTGAVHVRSPSFRAFGNAVFLVREEVARGFAAIRTRADGRWGFLGDDVACREPVARFF